MKGIMFGDDNMSNLTSASNEGASFSSSSNRNESGGMYPPQAAYGSVPNIESQPSKKKRNLPGNPDPEAEVIALSPKSLVATNRFMCEICNKGFQRDQNLQLHRRGHNLPWKLKQRSNKEVIKKKVYVCPEVTCVHHDPSRALGDLTGIKKHFFRKHGEKKWKCEKCSKRYAVQSDWKAHSKICGTREYRCDCGTLFSRRDSFITHRAFCDALAEESTRSSALIPPNNSLQMPIFPLKREQESDNVTNNNLLFRQDLPPWFDQNAQNPMFNNDIPSQLFSPRPQNANPNPNLSAVPNPSPPHMSATALLQKAAQMGVTMSKNTSTLLGPHMCTETAGSVLGLASTDQEMRGTAFANVTTSCMEPVGATTTAHSLLHADMLSNSLNSTSGFEGTTFEEAFNGMLNSKRSGKEGESDAGRGGGAGGGSDELTRDFLGIRRFPQSGQFLSMAGFDHIRSSSSYHHEQNQNQTHWQG